MKPILTLAISLLAGGSALAGLTVAQGGAEGSTGGELREVIVSHTDENGILQLYRMKEDGSVPTQLTHSKRGCRMPACSPDGRKVVYVGQTDRGLSLRLSDLDGKNVKPLVDEGMNLVPSWFPDSKHIVWMIAQPGEDPSRNSQIHIMNTETGDSRRLFTDPQQLKFSNSRPVVSPKGDRIAFVSNRSGNMRIWVSDLDGSNARLISLPEVEYHEAIKAPIEQKVPVWSPDGKWIAHWEGVEMVHRSRFTGKHNPERDRQISATFHVWVVGCDGKNRRKAGRGDDPTWSPDGFVTRAFPDPQRSGPKIMIETESGEKELPIVPRRRNWGRFTWLPQQAKHTISEHRGGGQAANPILPAADPHAVLLDGVVYLYPTCGHPGKFYAFSSRDLVTWRNHGPILDFSHIDWIPERKMAWAPALAEKDDKYYFYYSVGPKPSHLGVAVGNSPTGPYRGSRGTAVDLLYYRSNGHIKPIIMTDQGVGPVCLKSDTPPNVLPK